MKSQDILFLTIWGLTILASIIYLFYTKNNKKNAYYLLIVSISPFGVAIPIVILIVGFCYFIIEYIPNKLKL